MTRTGITGDGGAAARARAQYLDGRQGASRLPVCAGFGVRRAEQVALIGEHADGVIVGSALVEVLERGEDPAAFLRSLRARRGEADDETCLERRLAAESRRT